MNESLTNGENQELELDFEAILTANVSAVNAEANARKHRVETEQVFITWLEAHEGEQVPLKGKAWVAIAKYGDNNWVKAARFSLTARNVNPDIPGDVYTIGSTAADIKIPTVLLSPPNVTDYYYEVPLWSLHSVSEQELAVTEALRQQAVSERVEQPQNP